LYIQYYYLLQVFLSRVLKRNSSSSCVFDWSIITYFRCLCFLGFLFLNPPLDCFCFVLFCFCFWVAFVFVFVFLFCLLAFWVLPNCFIFVSFCFWHFVHTSLLQRACWEARLMRLRWYDEKVLTYEWGLTRVSSVSWNLAFWRCALVDCLACG